MTNVQSTGQNILSQVRPHFATLVPYVPIVPTDILGESGGIAPDRIVKLDGNENPYGPSPHTLEAIRRLDGFHIYPDPEQRALRSKIADYVHVGSEYIIPGNGSDEIIDLLMRLFLEPGDGVINCSPTFGMYPFNTQVCAGTLVEVPRRPDFTLDVDGILRAARQPHTKMLFLTSPNNPTGNLLRPEELEAVLAENVMIVVDEAYQEFAQSESYASWVPRHENLAVLRTFSKWAGLAGLRVGYGIMSPRLVRILDQVKPPYNVNVAALAGAEAALDDREYQLGRCALMVEERGRLFTALKSVPYLQPIPSQANFILCRVLGRDGGELKRWLETRGIFIKFVDGPYLRNCIRISIGTAEHTGVVLAALREYA